MRATFVYDYLVSPFLEGAPSRRTMAVFCAQKEVDQAQIVDDIAHYLRDKLAPDDLYFIGHSDLQHQIGSLFHSGELMDRLRGSIRSTPDTEILFVACSDKESNFIVTDRSGLSLDGSRSNSVVSELRQNGLFQLFANNSGLLAKSSAHHYKLPSGEHCDKFIRTANILRNSSEIDFVAYWLLPYLSDDVRYLYIDTAAITPIAYSLIQQRLLRRPAYIPPQIESFGSYAGIGKYPFNHSRKALALVSASTSGSLKKKIPLLGNQIVILFALGEGASTDDVLCDLTYKEKQNPLGYKPAIRYKDNECEFCAKNSKVISILDDQLLPERTILSAKVIGHKDAPRGLKAILEEFSRKEVFCVNFRGDNHSMTHPTYINVKTILDNPKEFTFFTKQLGRAFRKAISANLRYIIHLENDGSKLLATLARDHYDAAAQGDASPEVLGANQLQRKEIPASSTVLVVADCMSDGRDLMDIARSLRHVQTDGAIGFIVGVARVHSEHSYKEIRSSLTYGDDGLNICPFEAVYRIGIPHDISHNPWVHELTTLKKMKEWLIKSDQSVPEELGTRIILIEHSSIRGIINKIFLPKPDGCTEISVRENFVFFDTNTDTNAVSQADVFVAISCVLHSWRSEKNGGAATSVYHRYVVKPSCFDRFNDGVVQASILRAAKYGELNYEDDPQLSEQMLDVLRNVFRQKAGTSSEAAMEFLLALANAKLRLSPSDYKEVKCILNQQTWGCSLMQCLSNYVVQLKYQA